MRRLTVRLSNEDREALKQLDEAYRRHCGNARTNTTNVVKIALARAAALARAGKLFEVGA
jgi:hypothetical protein